MPITTEMGNIVRDNLTNYHGDFFSDGMYVETNGSDGDFIWMVRSAGTDIVAIKRLRNSEITREITEELIQRNERIFMFGRIKSEENYLEEITKEEALDWIKEFEK